MDAAAIALVRSGARDDAEADAFVNDFIARHACRREPTRPRCCTWRAFDATEIEGGWRVVSDGYMDTAFLPVVGIERDAARPRRPR